MSSDSRFYVGQTVYLTKHALSKGISTHIIKKVMEGGRLATLEGYGWDFFYLDKEVFPTKEEAVSDFQSRKQREINSLIKRLDSLKKSEPKFK